MKARFVHRCTHVLDRDATVAFYQKALGLVVARVSGPEDGSWSNTFMVDPQSGFEIELTWNRGRTTPYENGGMDIHIAFINLSGGVGIPYHPDEEGCDIMAIGEGVRKVYEEVLVPAGMDDVAIFTEMGRYMLAPYGALVAEAIHEKHIYKEYIGLDACAANLMRPAMYGAYHHITVLGKENAPCDHKYDVTGGLCENNDKFAIDRMLPKIDMGDLIYIHDTGAHGHSMGYNYNGKLRSAELLLCENGDVKLLRRAETPADYFATFDFTGLFQK